MLSISCFQTRFADPQINFFCLLALVLVFLFKNGDCIASLSPCRTAELHCTGHAQLDIQKLLNSYYNLECQWMIKMMWVRGRVDKYPVIFRLQTGIYWSLNINLINKTVAFMTKKLQLGPRDQPQDSWLHYFRMLILTLIPCNLRET